MRWSRDCVRGNTMCCQSALKAVGKSGRQQQRTRRTAATVAPRGHRRLCTRPKRSPIYLLRFYICQLMLMSHFCHRRLSSSFFCRLELLSCLYCWNFLLPQRPNLFLINLFNLLCSLLERLQISSGSSFLRSVLLVRQHISGVFCETLGLVSAK